jgi:thermitase
MKAAIIAVALIITIISVFLVGGFGRSPGLVATSPEAATGAAGAPDIIDSQALISKEGKTPETYLTNDPYLSKQWALDRIPASLINRDSTAVLIAVLDTGIDPGHEDLPRKVVASVNFTNTQTMADVLGHGTHLAGIIAAAANNGLGIAGIAPNSRLLNVKVADDNGMVWASVAAEGIVWAVDNGAKVINMGFFIPSPYPALEQAVDYAWSKGVVLVAATGNRIKSVPVYPAYYPEVIAVGATDVSGNLWPKSNYGDWVDAYAPGVDIYSTFPGNNYGYQSGTSVASAYVSGVAALAFASATDTNGNGRVNDEVTTLLKTLFALPE